MEPPSGAHTGGTLYAEVPSTRWEWEDVNRLRIEKGLPALTLTQWAPGEPLEAETVYPESGAELKRMPPVQPERWYVTGPDGLRVRVSRIGEPTETPRREPKRWSRREGTIPGG